MANIIGEKWLISAPCPRSIWIFFLPYFITDTSPLANPMFLQILIAKSNVYLNQNATQIWSAAACGSPKYKHQLSLNYLELSSPCIFFRLCSWISYASKRKVIYEFFIYYIMLYYITNKYYIDLCNCYQNRYLCV